MSAILLRFVLALTGVIAAPVAATTAACIDLLPPALRRAEGHHPISAGDLARLRDIVGGGYARAPSPFGISPDGSRAALVLRRGDPAANANCEGIVVITLHGDVAAHLVDTTYERAADVPAPSSAAYAPTRLIRALAPRWSPDGRWIAYLKRREGGVTQVWRARADGTRSQPVTRSPVDVEDFAWADAGSIIYASRPGLPAIVRAIDAEGLGGYHYDERFQPQRAARPYAPADLPVRFHTIDADGGEEREASTREMALLRLPGPAAWTARGPRGAVARIEPVDPGWILPALRLSVSAANGTHICRAEACDNLVGVWWLGDTLYFLRQEGWDRSQLAFYRWRPGARAPIQTYVTDDLLIGCQAVARELLCAHEAATTPRRLILLDPGKGTMHTVFDPNPETAAWRFGHVERLHWRNANGAETFGDLVLPPGNAPERPLPLIIVGYTARGFLRGGTGDEYPIQAFAARGYAVLVFERPRDVGARGPRRTAAEVESADLQGWADRRNVQSSLMTGIRLLENRGLIDRTRIGLTGFSDGATSAQWALIHDNIFAAVALSHVGMDRSSTMAYFGYAIADRFRAAGYPSLTAHDGDFWSQLSLSMNAEHVDVPMLLQVSDSELPSVVLTAAAFRELARPIDTYVFPGETHVKWQPAHRLAVYERNLDWFDFWLRGIEHPSAERDPEYRRWRDMRDQQCRGPSVGRTPGHCLQSDASF